MTPVPGWAQAGQTEQADALDGLFAELAAAPDPATAQAIADKIWASWMAPADPVLAGRMAETLELRWRGDMGAVIAALDAVITDFPDYAEGYNQRATVYFMLGNYEKSLLDIEATLEREPRHFGALAGRALIRREQGDRDGALADMRRALEIHPFLSERALFPELEELAI